MGRTFNGGLLGGFMKYDELLRAVVDIEKAAGPVAVSTFTDAHVSALAERLAEKSRTLRERFEIGRDLDALRGEIAVVGESIRSAIVTAKEQPEVAAKRIVVVQSTRTLLNLIERFFHVADNQSRAA